MDWDRFRKRLATALGAMQGADASVDPERERAILRRRARALARPPEVETAVEQIELLTFTLGPERYAIETSYVTGVERHAAYTPLPSSSDYIVGVTSIRGEIVAVVELGRVLDVSRRVFPEHAWLIVLGTDRVGFGVLVDAVDDVTTLDATDMHSFADRGARTHLRAVTPHALIVLDGASLIADSRLYVDEREGATA